MPKIKVLHVTSTPRSLGGVERLLLDMAPHYDLSRFSVCHCNLFDEAQGAGSFPAELKATGLTYFEIKENRWYEIPRIVRELLSVIIRERIDILHLHMVHSTIIGGFVGLVDRSTRVVVTKHYTYEMVRHRILSVMDRMFTNRAHAIIAVSRRVEDDLVRHGACAERTRTIYNGIDLAAFDRRAEERAEQIKLAGGNLLIGCVGNYHRRKGQEFVIRAMPEILEAFPAARLVLWGEGSERDRLERLSRSLGVNGAVSVAGFAENAPALLKHLDLFVQPSLQEPFGIAILEAMAACKAVVATNVDGIPEIVLEGLTGSLVAPADPSAIARAVYSLLDNDELRKRMGKAARERVAHEFSIEKTVRLYEQLYRELVPGRL